MKLTRIWAMAKKEFLHVIRDPLSLGMAVMIPMLLLGLFGYALSLDVDRVPVIVWDQSGTEASRNFIAQFDGSRYFSVRQYATNYSQVEQAIDTRSALAGMVIPRDFAQQISAGRTAAVQFIVDGSDSNTATIAIGYATAVTSGYNENLALQQVQRISPQPLQQPLEIRQRVWFNEELQSKNYIVPGLIAVIMMILSALLTSLTIAREWEQGTMEQLISTPIKPHEMILGKLLPYFAIGIFDVVLAVVAGQFLFNVPLRGDVLLLFGLAAMFLIGALSMGMLASIISKSQLMASQLAIILTFVPSYLLSGFMFPILSMPRFIQYITYLIPARYFITILKGIYLKGVGLAVLGGEVALLAVFCSAVLLLANVKLKKKLV